MSKSVTVEIQMNDVETLRAACRRLELKEPEYGRHELYDDKCFTGYGVRLKDWSYPVVIDMKTSECHYDNYEGNWGDIRELHRLSQAYACERLRREVNVCGDSLSAEHTLENGNIVMEIEV